MKRVSAIAIFDSGKTNKKLVLFNEQDKIIHEENTQLAQTADDDGFPCEDVHTLTAWVKDSFDNVTNDPRFHIKAVNFSAYGASFVYIDDNGKPAAPLYNYLKPFPQKLQQKFYKKYGGESAFAKEAASPVLGSLNSGMQIYRLKYEKPDLFAQIKYALHLPQYLHYILTNHPATDITSIGCHTNLWDFKKDEYHRWVNTEKIAKYFAPILPCNSAFSFAHNDSNYISGIGLHDSSAALIPYLHTFIEPFVLISTGTWCISFNPFNHSMLTDYELHQDCLCYLNYKAQRVKASRLFAGNEHEQQTKRLAEHFNKPVAYYQMVKYDASVLKKSQRNSTSHELNDEHAMVQQSSFKDRDLKKFQTYEQAYHQLMSDIMQQQVRSLKLVLQSSKVKKIFVDGGFSKNAVYMNLLAGSFPKMEVHAAAVSHASSLGAALIMHEHWNKNPLPDNLVELKRYSVR